MPDPLTFSIVPDDGETSFDALYRSVEGVRRLIRDVDGIVTQRPSRRRARRWYITGFSSSNPTITITPAHDGTDSGERATEAIVGGIKWINQPAQVEPPPHFSERELEDLRELKKLRATGVSRIEFSCNGTTASVIPSRVEEQIDRILGAGDAEYGALEGMLDAINLHKTPTLTIWEDITGLAVRCSFPQQYEPIVRDLLRRRVRISGLVRYFANGRPRTVTSISDIEDLTPDPALTSAAFGSIPDLTDGLGSERYLRIVRGN